MGLAAEAQAIRELLTDPAHWTQGTAARDANGIAVPARSATAAKWDLLGAALKLECRQFQMLSNLTLRNDAMTHAEVLNYLDRFIADQASREAPYTRDWRLDPTPEEQAQAEGWYEEYQKQREKEMEESA